MPKDRRVNSSSFDRAMLSPYACSFKNSDHNHPERSSLPVGDESEWEEARCPICMEHPHNAVLLVCSSQEKGCRPFMCDTSYRHSNCLDMFLRSASSLGHQELQNPELVCPLCRGAVTGWIVVDAARKSMDSKIRNCSLETCNFIGSYSDLRKHARVEHPSGRPSEASPTRQMNWAEFERQRDFEDALAQQYDMDYEWDGWPDWDGEWGEYDLWSDESFFDFSSGMSDIEDDMIGGIFRASAVFTVSLGSLYLSSPEEDTVAGSSGRSDTGQMIPTPTHSRLNDLEENMIPNSRSSHQRENTSAWSRSIYRRENGAASNSSTGSRYHRENGLTTTRTRSNFQRENGPGTSRTGSSRRREIGSSYSRTRSSSRRDNGPESFRRR